MVGGSGPDRVREGYQVSLCCREKGRVSIHEKRAAILAHLIPSQCKGDCSRGGTELGPERDDKAFQESDSKEKEERGG